MVGDGNVVVAELPGRFGHFFDRILAVAGRGVHLQVALHILEGDQFRKFVVFGGGDLAGIFAQFRRNEIELQFRIDFFFRPARDALFAFQCSQRVFVERVAHLVGAAAERDVVLFRTGKVKSAAPKFSFSSIRTSTCKPSPSVKLTLFSPCASVWSMPGNSRMCLARASTCFCEVCPSAKVTSKSRSPTVSLPRRSEPAGVTDSTAFPAFSMCAAMASAAASAVWM